MVVSESRAQSHDEPKHIGAPMKRSTLMEQIRDLEHRITKLDDRRITLIHQLDAMGPQSEEQGGNELLHFPSPPRITVQKYNSREWPPSGPLED
jgi:hypothetical protein